MQSKPSNIDDVGQHRPQRRNFVLRLLYAGGALLLVYLVTAYVILPLAWRTEVRRHPDLSSAPRITQTANGIPGDPLNVALEGSESDVVHAMTAAKWYPADPITFRTSVRIAVDALFRRPDDDAPVSDLYLFGRKQDLAFEHSVTFDERVGLSHTTGQITHHIGPDVDAERDRLIAELQTDGQTQEVYWVDGFHQQLSGRNGGGDPWHTDGRLGVAVLLQHTNTPAATTNHP